MASPTAESPVVPTQSSPQVHSSSTSRKEPCCKPSADDWESVRPTIRQLYIDENKTLAEVSDILASNYGFYASPKQYKNRFKQWGLWKNLSTRDAARLIQLKASRDSAGKTSTFVRAGQKLDFDRVQKTIRRSRNRVPKSSAERKPPKLGRAEAAAPAGNQPRVECRTPSPEPHAVNKDGLDLLESLDSDSLRVGGTPINHDFNEFGSDTFMPVSSPSAAGQFDPFGASRYEDPRVETIWDSYARAHHKLALRSEWLRTDALTDPLVKRFRGDNALLAMLEPLVATSGQHFMRELFLANFVSSFMHQPELSQFALRLDQTIGQAFTDTKTTSHYAAVIESALQYLGLQTYTRRFIGTKQDIDPIESLLSTDETLSGLKTETPDGLSPDVDFPSPATDMPPTPPSCNDYDHGPDTNDFEAAAFAYHLRETDTAEVRLRALTCYGGSPSTKGQVLMRLAWYCLSRVQRESGRDEEADGSLMQAIRGSTFFPATDGTEWDEVSYLFM